MSPRGGRRCPPALLALLLGLAGSRGLGSPECQNRAVTVGASLCLVPQKPLRVWTEIHWKWEINSEMSQKILTITRGGIVPYPRGPFHGRVEFQPGNLSLCISPVRRGEHGLYRAEFETSSKIVHRCFRVSVWDPVPRPELRSQIVQRDRGWCRLALLCSSPANVSYSWACAGNGPGGIPGEIPGQIPEQIPGEIAEQIPGEIPGQISEQIPEQIPEPIPEPILEPILEQVPEQILEQIPEQIPGEILEQILEQIPGSPSWLLRSLPAGAEPQMCVCNASNPAGWSAARAALTCPVISGNFGHWTPLAVAVGLLLLLVGSCCCCWRRRRRRKKSREGTPGMPPLPALTVYAEVGEKKPRRDPAGAGEAAPEGATVYAAVTPRTLEHPRHREEPKDVTIYSTVQFHRRPSSSKRKRLDPSLVSTAYLEDNGGYRPLGFPNPAGRQRP